MHVVTQDDSIPWFVAVPLVAALWIAVAMLVSVGVRVIRDLWAEG